MATLGEAFIAVHADTSPFRREMRQEIQGIANAIEHDLKFAIDKALERAGSGGDGEKAGRRVGKGMGKGIGDELGDKGKPPWITLTSALASALDDGISALPTELKAAMAIAIIAVSPLIIAGLSGAIASGISLGVLGFGVGLATQFEAVQDHWQEFQQEVRKSLVGAADGLIVPLMQALDMAEDRFAGWSGQLGRIFDSVAKNLDPIVSDILDGIGYIFDVFESNVANIDIFSQALGDAIYMITSGLAEIIDMFLQTGDAGADAFRDLVYVLTSMVVFLAQIFAWITKIYGFLRDAIQATSDWVLILQPLGFLFKGIANEVDNNVKSTTAYATTNLEYIQGVGTIIALTKDEEKELKNLKDAIDAANDAAWNAIDSNIAFEASLDDITESIKRNGRTLDITTKEGRANLREIGDAIKLAQKRAEERAQSGELTQQQLGELYDKEIEQIYRAGEAMGISRDKLREIYGIQIDMLKLPPPNTQWAADLAMYAAAAAGALERANRAAWNLPNRIGGPQPFAEGGIVRSPTVALIGEAGTEAVIPMTRPARAAEIMRQTGLDRMFGGSGDVSVSVFLGNEAFDQHIQKVVVQDNRAQARQLGFGVR